MTTPATISEGATGPTVRWLQYLLVRRTLSDSQIDGIFGPVTKTAVEQFQAGDHLAVDGIVGPLTWSALHGDGAEPPTLTEGSHGTVVEKLQTALNEGRGDFAPSSNPVLATDGDYGPHTAAAVKGAQKSGAIEADGVVCLQTWPYQCTPPGRCWPISAAFQGRGKDDAIRPIALAVGALRRVRRFALARPVMDSS